MPPSPRIVPSQPSLDPLAAALLESQRAHSAALIETLKEGNADRKEASRDLLQLLRDQEQKQTERHGELLRNFKKEVRPPPTGPLSKLTAFIADSPAVKSAAVNLFVLLLGGMGTYAMFYLTGTHSTPTPVDVHVQEDASP